MPIYNNVLAGSGQAGASGDLGEEITQSLRFNGSGFLTRAQSSPLLNTDRTFTFSTWFKHGNMGETNIFGIHSSSGSDNWLLSWTNFSNPSFAGRDTGSGWGQYSSSASFRDPNAWYHLFLTCSSGVLSLRVNNVLQDQTDTQNHSMDRDFVIGAENASGGTPMTAYLAETYFFQGSVLDAVNNHFIRQNENGIWVPDTPTNTDGSDFSAADYGTNGWHLTYDPAGKAGQTGNGAGIGADHSPNNNHFTPSSFDTADVALYSKDVFTSPTPFNVNSTDKNFSGTNDGTKAFDGSTGLWPIGASANEDFCIFRPSTPLSNVTSLTVEGASDFDDILVNGTSTGQSTSGSTLNSPLTVTLPSSPLTLTSFAVKGASATASQNYFARISVGTGGNAAVALVDNTDNDIDYFDTPTSNYATLNPLFEDTVNTPTEANLATTSSGSFSETTSTIGLGTTESWYAEIYFDGAPTNPPNNQYGFTVIPAGGYNNTNIFSATNAYIAGWTRSGTTFSLSKTNSDIVSGTLSSTPGANSVLQFAYNASTRELYVGIDNTNWLKSDGTFNSTFNAAEPTQTLDAPDGGEYMLGATVFTTTARINYGQRPFIFTPPTDFKALQTNNLPAPTIKEGKKQFDVLTWTGDGTSPKTRTGLDFKPDLIWIKDVNNSFSIGHRLYDSVRGAGVNKYLDSQSSDGEGVGNDEQFGFVTGFVDGGFTAEAGSGGDDYVNDTTTNYVAWCWKAGDTPNVTYTVKVVNDSGNKYRFDDFGTSAVTLDLEEGGTYVFDQSDASNSGHPLRFSTTSDGTHGGGSEFTTGVTTTGTPGSAGAKTTIVVGSNTATLHYYCSAHSGMGGQANTNDTKGSSNFAGTIQSRVTANTDAGFSIVEYKGTGSAGTFAHGLAEAPEWAIIKRHDGTAGWSVYHKSMGNQNKMELSSTNGISNYGTGTDFWNGTSPTNQVFSIGVVGTHNTLNEKYIAYLWAPVEGFSKFGSYTGNGAPSSEGPFVYTGFKVRWLMIKSKNSSDWRIYDTARTSQNENKNALRPNLPNMQTSDSNGLDLLSNGFKIRWGNTELSSSGVDYLYMAFAENPFGGETVAPVIAR